VDAARTVRTATGLADGQELGLGKDLAAVALLVVVKGSVGAAADLVKLSTVSAVVLKTVAVGRVAARDGDTVWRIADSIPSYYDTKYPPVITSVGTLPLKIERSRLWSTW
jgi:hypothetical protein